MITAAELLDPRAGVVPTGARKVRNLNMRGPDIDEAAQPANNEGDPAMPKGIYNRKPREAAAPAEGAALPDPKPSRKKKRAAGKKARTVKRPRHPRAPAVSSSPRFGVFDDGSVQINTESCKGNLAQAEVEALRAFLGAKVK